MLFENNLFKHNPVGKIAEKAVCRSAFLTTWYCILSAELTKTTPSDCFFCDSLTGKVSIRCLNRLLLNHVYIFELGKKYWKNHYGIQIRLLTRADQLVLIDKI